MNRFWIQIHRHTPVEFLTSR